jgi:hypothetical protein
MATSKAKATDKADKAEPEPKQPEEPPQVLGRDIDSRMDALLQDHIRMGARPRRGRSPPRRGTTPRVSTKG